MESNKVLHPIAARFAMSMLRAAEAAEADLLYPRCPHSLDKPIEFYHYSSNHTSHSPDRYGQCLRCFARRCPLWYARLLAELLEAQE